MIVEFQIDKSKYRIECPEDEKEKVLDLAKKVNDRVKKMANHFKKADEKTLLALCCVMMEDEIKSSSSTEINEEIENGSEKIIEKLESLAKKIEKY